MYIYNIYPLILAVIHIILVYIYIYNYGTYLVWVVGSIYYTYTCMKSYIVWLWCPYILIYMYVYKTKFLIMLTLYNMHSSLVPTTLSVFWTRNKMRLESDMFFILFFVQKGHFQPFRYICFSMFHPDLWTSDCNRGSTLHTSTYICTYIIYTYDTRTTFYSALLFSI